MLTSTFCGQVQISGEFVFAKIVGANEEAMLNVARNHISKSGLNWDLSKPRSWTTFGVGPHVTLQPAMRRFLGEYLPVTITGVNHFYDPPSRWVVLDVTIPQKYATQYEPHVAIGQQRLG